MTKLLTRERDQEGLFTGRLSQDGANYQSDSGPKSVSSASSDPSHSSGP
jgi:hypothetical protein